MTAQYRLDWRWVERYRELASYDGHWWLTSAGPFTEEEQHQRGQLRARPLDEETKESTWASSLLNHGVNLQQLSPSIASHV